MAEVIRTALDEYLEDEPDPSGALAATFGTIATIEPPSREEWTRG